MIKLTYSLFNNCFLVQDAKPDAEALKREFEDDDESPAGKIVSDKIWTDC